MTAKVLVNGRPVAIAFSRTAETWTLEIDGRSGEAVVTQPETGVYHVMLEGRSYEVFVSGDRMDINGQELHVVLDDPRDAPAKGLEGSLQGRQSIAAPMPGKIVRVLVAEGDEVQRDQGIVVIEAMKMQNEMKSPKAGRIASLPAKDGTTVAAGDVLAVVE
jgi:biotin carboxyl carrier protein